VTENEELLTFFKALADANRLKIVGLLASQSYTVEQLAALLGVSPSTVSHHLSKLSEAGLVTASAQSYYNYYKLESEHLEAMARRMTAADTFPAVAAGLGGESAAETAALVYDQKVLHNYLLPSGKLKTIPSQRKKLMVVLSHIVQTFEPGRRYPEQEVNEILTRFHDDTASLRRELIGANLMQRESSGQAYWRVETNEG
jgi:biotin operon repressor